MPACKSANTHIYTYTHPKERERERERMHIPESQNTGVVKRILSTSIRGMSTSVTDRKYGRAL